MNPSSKALEISEGAISHGAVQDKYELASLIDLLLERRIENVCEIGTYCGGSLWAWCQIANGFIASIDYGDVPRDKFLEWYAPQLLWTPKMSSRDPALPGMLREKRGWYDFLFVDGDHSYEGAKADYEQYYMLVRPGGIIAFHDIALESDDPGYQVKRFWQELKASGRKCIEFDNGKNMGLGVIFRD